MQEQPSNSDRWSVFLKTGKAGVNLNQLCSVAKLWPSPAGPDPRCFESIKIVALLAIWMPQRVDSHASGQEVQFLNVYCLQESLSDEKLFGDDLAIYCPDVPRMCALE